MFFHLEYRFSGAAGPVGVQVLDQPALPVYTANTLYVHPGRQRLETVGTPGGQLLLLGDPVFRPGETPGAEICPLPGKIAEAVLFEQVRGHYYWFLIHPQGICCGTSFGAIFPVYYHTVSDGILLSSSSFSLAEKTNAPGLNRRNLLERLLFNYPFFPNTWWTGIRLLDAHRYLRLNGQGARVDGHFDLSGYFGSGEKSSSRDLDQLTGLFAEESGLFFPDARFGVSFTGGFDGRTLVAAARHAGHSGFLTYSFGRSGASDVTFPAAQTKRLGIPYQPILLDQDYLKNHALESALAFMRLTEYNGNFGRPHYHYAAKKLAQDVDFLITGNFGSEMFRALHQPGVMMTENLIGFFSAADNRWKDNLRRAAQAWGKETFRADLDELLADLEAYRAPMAGWDLNHQFYYFVVSEIFRKYFGPELIMQSHYLNNRTPFLSLRFFRALNDTIWSGVHSRLFEKQKNKRLKGQVFYSAFLRSTDPQLYRQNTSKGYSPADVLEAWRWPLLAGKVALRKYLQKPEDDSNSENAYLLECRTPIIDWIKNQADGLTDGIVGQLLRTTDTGDFEETIKRCSISAGWVAAARASVET